MVDQGPPAWRQSCTCNLDARVRRIQIGSVIVGVVGLDDALEQLYQLGRQPGPKAAEELLAMIKTRNWVAHSSEENYKEALLREYSAHWETKSGASRKEEKRKGEPMKALGECRLAVVGVGLLGGLLVDRLLTCGECSRGQIIACESNPERRTEIAEWVGVTASGDNLRAAEADVIILAVPPDQVVPVLETLAPRLTPEHLIVSTAAAVPLTTMERAAGEGVPVVRTLPNSPALVGQGVTPVCYGRAVTPEARALAERLLACWGQGVEIPEAQMNLCVSLTATAPTYIFPVIAALTQVGVAGGLEREVARRLAAGVVQGSGALVRDTGQSPLALMALTPLQPLREAEAKALFIEAVEVARSKMDKLQARLKL